VAVPKSATIVTETIVAENGNYSRQGGRGLTVHSWVRLTDVVVGGTRYELGDVWNGLKLFEENRETFSAKRIAAVYHHVSSAVRVDVTVLVFLPCHLHACIIDTLYYHLSLYKVYITAIDT